MANTPNGKTGVVSAIYDWIEHRLPIFSFFKHYGAEYQVPKNLSYSWNYGSLAGLALIIQIITGLFLAMQYTPHTLLAFDSVERIMRDVNYGWLLRYMHAVGASMFFIVVYLHMARSMYYGSYKSPREILWFFGIIIFITMMATAFMGYVLPWGQMSFWGAQVITNLFSAIPFFGQDIVTWLWGGYTVGNPTLNRFFALHYLLPFIIFGLVILHVVALHIHGSNNPTGVEIKSGNDTIPFHPYYTVKDMFGVGLFLILFSLFLFFMPNVLGHPDNYIPANPMVTPAHIVPEWYFLPFYAILRSIPDKLAGVSAMFGAIMIWFVLPWLDGSTVKSARYRPLFKIATLLMFIDFIVLGYIGGQPAEEPYISVGQVCTTLYFLHFLVILPFISRWETPMPEPASIDEDYKQSHSKAAK
ncbi:MAG: cytochrome b/b6 [Proteobacteria bacterium]|nr:cytochrome b/b6 [Pseudomonadota bacterium]